MLISKNLSLIKIEIIWLKEKCEKDFQTKYQSFLTLQLLMHLYQINK